MKAFLLLLLTMLCGCNTLPPGVPNPNPQPEVASSYLNFKVSDEPVRGFTLVAPPSLMPFPSIQSRAEIDPSPVWTPPVLVIPLPPIPDGYDGPIQFGRLMTSYDFVEWEETDLFSVVTNADGSRFCVPYQVLNAPQQFFRVVGE